MVFTGDPGLRDSIYNADWNNFAPRFGFAWDVQGTGSTVIRSAYGIFFRAVPLNIERVSNSGSAFRSLSTDIQNPPSFVDPYASFPGGDPFPFTPRPASALKTYHFVRPVVTSLLDPASHTGYTQQWNLTVERQLRSDLGLSLSYVGNHSIGIMAAYQANPAVYGPGATAGNTDARRIYPGFGPLGLTSPWQFGNYHSLQAQVIKRTARGLSVVANYVYSRCMDNSSSQIEGADAGGGSQYHKFNLRADYAPCEFDVQQAANLSLVYDLPRLESVPGAAGRLLNGWKFTSIVDFRSGLPFNVLSGRDNSFSGTPFNDFADQLGKDSGRPAGADALQKWFNTAAFVENAVGTFGTAQRDALRGPGSSNWDLGLLKDTKIREQMNLQFRFEAFNVLNHPNFNNPVGTVTNANFGKILGAGDPRVLQMALKLAF
jgi:hypothetical protein